MKKHIFKIFVGALAVAGIVTGVQYVSAYTKATVPDIFDSGDSNQIKKGILLSEKILLSPLSIFTTAYLPSNTSWLNIGGSGYTSGSNSITSEGGNTPLTVVVNNSSNIGTQFLGESSGQCTPPVGIVASGGAKAFEFTSSKTGNADIIARQVGLNGGTLKDNSVLAAVDNQGNAVWAQLVVENGQIVIRDNDTLAPIKGDLECAVPVNPNPIMGCTNSSADNYNVTATQDDGSCVKYAWEVDWNGQCLATSQDIADAKNKANKNIIKLENTLTAASKKVESIPTNNRPWYTLPEPAYMVSMESAYNAANWEEAGLTNAHWMPISFDNNFMQLWSATTKGNHSRLASSYTFPQVGMTQQEQQQAIAAGVSTEDIEAMTLKGVEIGTLKCIVTNLTTGIKSVVDTTECTKKQPTPPDTIRICNTAIIPAVTKNFEFRTTSWEQVGLEATPTTNAQAPNGYNTYPLGVNPYQKIFNEKNNNNQVVYYDVNQNKCVLENVGQKTLNVTNTYTATPGVRLNGIDNNTIFKYIDTNQSNYVADRLLKKITESQIANDRAVTHPTCVTKIPYASSPAVPSNIDTDAFSNANFGMPLKYGHKKARLQFFTMEYKVLNP